MARFLIPLLLSLLLLSCGGNQSSSPAGDASSPSSSTPSPSASDATSTESDVVKRVEQIYNDVLSNNYAAEEEEGIDNQVTVSPDEKYCSQSWNALLGKVIDFDTTHHPDDIGFFEADYWIMGQDFDHPTASHFELVEENADRAVVDFELHNFGVTHVRLQMVKERGGWYIDNFIDLDNDFDWKAGMTDYLR